MKKTNNENLKNTEKLILDDSKLNIDKLLKKYNTSLEGISVVDVDDRINKYGRNIIDIKQNGCNKRWQSCND